MSRIHCSGHSHIYSIHMQELSAADVVVNCSGLGAVELFGDKSMYPIRGHVIRVRAPWVKGIYFCDEQTYVIPNEDTVVGV